ncbi:MAG: antibiotic biosynthesis monooxygenase [Saprospiraceae bacterium]|nr:antibiotic biosynthesis monooxygenase [Saprospiraceae bacterium]
MRSLLSFFIMMFFLSVTSAGMGTIQRERKSPPVMKEIIVLVKYKALPGKEDLAIKTLAGLLKEVSKEPHYVNIVLHVDPMDKTNILLYEQWSDEDYYKGDHMKTHHLLQFMSDSRAFLAGPPEISFWVVEK